MQLLSHKNSFLAIIWNYFLSIYLASSCCEATGVGLWMTELFFSSTYTLFLDGKEDLSGKLKNSATVLVITQVYGQLWVVYMRSPSLFSWHFRESRESSVHLPSNVFILLDKLGPWRTDPLQRYIWDSTCPQSRVANDLTFGIWLDTVWTINAFQRQPKYQYHLHLVS